MLKPKTKINQRIINRNQYFCIAVLNSTLPRYTMLNTKSIILVDSTYFEIIIVALKTKVKVTTYNFKLAIDALFVLSYYLYLNDDNRIESKSLNKRRV